jgi:hypothetical protein
MRDPTDEQAHLTRHWTSSLSAQGQTRRSATVLAIALLLLLIPLTAGACGVSTSGGGPTGATAAQMVERHRPAVTVPVGADGTATASCTGGEQLLGGGYEVSAPGTIPFASFPSAADTWTARVHNRASAPLQLTAFADCLQAPFSVGAAIVTGTPDTGFPPPSAHVEANADAECPIGSTLTGGGFQLTGDGNGYIWNLRPWRNPTRWDVWVAIGLAVTGPITVSAYAVCASAHLVNPPDPHPSFPFTIPAMGSAGSTASCPTGQVLTAGGYWDDTEASALTSPPVHADTSAPHVESGHDGAALAPWRVRGSNLTDFDHSELNWLVCLVLAEPGVSETPTTAATTGTATATPGASSAHIVVHTNAMTVDATSKAPVTASCDGQHGEQMIGGGYKVSPPSPKLHVLASYPSSTTSWTVFARNIMPTPGTVIAYVYCFVGPPTLTITLAAATPTTIAAGPAGGAATASCAASVATAGGFYFSPPHAAASNNLDPDGWLAASQPGPHASSWSIAGYAIAEGGGASPGVDLVAMAVCVAADHVAAGSFPSATVSVASGSDGGGTVPASACAAGETLVTGGFKPDPGLGWNFIIDGGESLDHWFVDALNGNPTGLQVVLVGECVRFS